MEYQQFPFALKSVSEKGHISGYCSVFGHLDLQGDCVEAGAFKESIAETGGRVPVLMAHNTGRVVGFGTAAREDARGLYVEAQLALNTDDGRNAFELAKLAQSLSQPFGLSIGYSVREGGSKFVDDVRHLTDLTLHEWSLAAVPACPPARLTAVKSSDGAETAAIMRALARHAISFW